MKSNLQVLANVNDSFQFETARLQVKIRPATKSSKSGFQYTDRDRKGRAHVWGAPEPSLSEPAYMERGKFPQLDKEWDRYNREVVKLMKAELVQALEAIGYSDSKVEFSRYAGCSCPCSPGFIFKGREFNGLDLFVTVKRPVRGLLKAASSVNLEDFDEVIFPEV